MMDCVATTDRLLREMEHPESSKTVMRSVLATREGFGQIWLAVLGIFATGCDWLIKKYHLQIPIKDFAYTSRTRVTVT